MQKCESNNRPGRAKVTNRTGGNQLGSFRPPTTYLFQVIV